MGGTGVDIANLFAAHFSRVYDGSVCPIPEFSIEKRKDVMLLPFSLSDVFAKISALPDKLSSGPDMIPNLFLRNCIFTISKPLHLLFNKSLETGIFPEFWKHSYIIPIFKSGERENVENYMGVCSQSAVAKLFDSLVYDQLN